MLKNIYPLDTSLVELGRTLVFGLTFALAIVSVAPAKTVTVQVPVEKQVLVPYYVNKNDQAQIRCLAENAYFEAGNQGTMGMVAVSNVVMNRVADKRFPKSPCAVIHQRAKGSCQFSWTCKNPPIKDRALLARTTKVAEQVYLGNQGDVTRGATFYHARYVKPSWSRTFTLTTVIGDHYFYSRR